MLFKKYGVLSFLLALVIGFSSCTKTVQETTPIDASILNEAQIVQMSDLLSENDVEIQDGLEIPDDATVYLFDSEVFADSKNSTTDVLKRKNGPEPDLSCGPACSTAVANAVAQLQPLADANCENYVVCLYCCNTYSTPHYMMYLTIMVSPSTLCIPAEDM